VLTRGVEMLLGRLARIFEATRARQATRYRNYAQRLYAMAEAVPDERARERLTRFAQRYERLADRLTPPHRKAA
jgi:hypothetical protein